MAPFGVALVLTVLVRGPCDHPALAHQARDQATIVRLEHVWNAAFLNGDTALERCLLSPDFTEIMRSGEVKHLADELGFAAKNSGHPLPDPGAPAPDVLLHGDVAVAYAEVKGKAGATRYADFYVWDGSAWHAYFAQQTPVTPK